MIAKVRIAPVEQWCAAYKPLAETHKVLVGMPVQIHTDSMRDQSRLFELEAPDFGPCDGRGWNVTNESENEIADRLGEARKFRMGGGLRLCEHMLEMD